MNALFQSTTFRVAAVVVLALLATVGVLAWQLKDSIKANGVLSQQVQTMQQTNASNVKHYEAELATARQNADIANAQRALAEQRNSSLQETLDAIHHSPASARAPVSPVVRDTVDRLWNSPPRNP